MPKTTPATKDEALAVLRAKRDALLSVERSLTEARSDQGQAALDARDAGATLTEIGDALGLSKQRAFDLIAAAQQG